MDKFQMHVLIFIYLFLFERDSFKTDFIIVQYLKHIFIYIYKNIIKIIKLL